MTVAVAKRMLPAEALAKSAAGNSVGGDEYRSREELCNEKGGIREMANCISTHTDHSPRAIAIAYNYRIVFGIH